MVNVFPQDLHFLVVLLYSASQSGESKRGRGVRLGGMKVIPQLGHTLEGTGVGEEVVILDSWLVIILDFRKFTYEFYAIL